ncbi:MAG TPA: peptidoglycan-associated lipoprotein Pal [Rubrivivax sp.]|nr:peptidoglycan-associated lipoprotein Pal [Rubrivivax sp.]
MKSRASLSLAALALVALIAGCASGVKLQEAPVETRTPTPVGGSAAGAGGVGSGASASGTGQSEVKSVDLTGAAGGTGSAAAVDGVGRVIYFDFDSFVVKDEFRPIVEAYARNLVANKQRRLVVEGHADERGSREYNLALGQKRAEAVVRSLVLLGVGPDQVEAVSFGEERPAVQGSNEEAWAKNRRAELRDR